MLRRIALPLLLACLGAAAAAEGPSFAFAGPRFNFRVLGGVPLPAGADVRIGYPLGQTPLGPLEAVLALGAGYESKSLLRDDASGDAIADAAKSEYDAPNAQWDLGLVLGLLPGDSGDKAELFAAWRGRYDLYLNDLSLDVFPDAGGHFGTAFIAGAAWKDVATDDYRVKSGLAAEASAEWGPSGLSSVAVDYLRLGAKAEAYLPLFSRGKEGLNLFSSYLAGYASVDWAEGRHIPIHVMQSFGGRSARDGLGGSVRGYPSKAWDAAFKAVANLELRLLGPALFGIPWLLPMAYGFADLGLYEGLPGAATPSQADAGGRLASVGGGFALDLFDFAFAGVKAGLMLPGDDALFPVYLPEGKTAFFSIEFMLHF